MQRIMFQKLSKMTHQVKSSKSVNQRVTITSPMKIPINLKIIISGNNTMCCEGKSNLCESQFTLVIMNLLE